MNLKTTDTWLGLAMTEPASTVAESAASDEPEMGDGSGEEWHRACALYRSTSLQDRDSNAWHPIPVLAEAPAPVMLADSAAGAVRASESRRAADSDVEGASGSAPPSAASHARAVTGTLVFTEQPAETADKPPEQTGYGMPVFVQAAGTFMSGRRRELGDAPPRKLCPTCAPSSCHPECAWARQETSEVDIPFAPVPSRVRVVALWCVLVSIFAGGVGASLYYSGAFDPELRTPPEIRYSSVASPSLLRCVCVCVCVCVCGWVDGRVGILCPPTVSE